MAELAALLTDPAARAALAQRDITAVYRLLSAAGVTQARIGQATGQRQTEVSEIVSGRQVLSVALLERIADGFGIPRGWMGLAYTPGLVPEPTPPEDAPIEDERHDNLFRHAATVLLGEPIFGPADPIPVRSARTPVPRRIGQADIEQVAAATERLGQLCGDLGGIPMTDALTAHAQASEALLRAAMHEPVRQRLLVVLSDAHRAAGGAASSAGLRDLARQHFIRSMDCAGAAGDMLRAVVSLNNLGCLELDTEPNAALKFFQLGAATAPSALTRAKSEYRCAHALGLLGITAEALAALRRARDFHEAASGEPRPWEHFATGLSHIEGRAYFALGRFDRAAAAAASAAEASYHAVECTVSNSSLLAAAQLQCGELRSGLSTAGRVVDLAKGLRSVSMRGTLAPLQGAAEARRDSACRDLAHELATLRAAA